MVLAVAIVFLALPPTVMRIVSSSVCRSSLSMINHLGKRFSASTVGSRTYPCRSTAALPILYLQHSLSRVFYSLYYASCDTNEWMLPFIAVRKTPTNSLSSCSRALLLVILATRVSQLAAELLVVIITWWYTYQSYRLRNHGIKGAKTISSLLVYNGECSLTSPRSLLTRHTNAQEAYFSCTRHSMERCGRRRS